MLKFQNVSFSYEKGKKILSDFSFELRSGEILAIMGESGCGKSTVLNLSAGLLKAQSGNIVSQAKKISYVFQDPRLFPWLTVVENIKAVSDLPDSEIIKILDEMNLSDARDKYPNELSGGMKSRVSLARALAYGGDLYLLDEPFAALDEELREKLAVFLRNKIKADGASALFVTHQRCDADIMADRVLEMNA